MHSKTVITFAGCIISILGWFLFNLVIGEIYPGGMNIYLVRRAFVDNYGRTLLWWTTGLWTLLTLIVIELILGAVRRVYWPGDWEVMQRLEKNGELDKLDEESGDAEAEVEEDNEARRSVAAQEGARGGAERGPSLQVESRGASFQDRRPSLQDWRPSLHVETRRGSLHEGQMPERRRKRAFTTLQEEGGRYPAEEAGRNSAEEGGTTPAEER